MEQLIQRYQRVLESTPTKFLRYLDSVINWNSRLIGILGSRGVGKTTLMRQRIKLHDDIATTIYVDAGDVYFSNHRLIDFAENFYKNGGKKIYIDEIHRYNGWSTEIKMMYDFIPDLYIVYSGSSIMDLEKGGADLSRRRSQYYLEGLSFREYLLYRHGISTPILTLDEILNGHDAIIEPEQRPIALFKEYLRCGYYPFGNEPDFLDKLSAAVSTTLENDIPQYARINLSTIKKIKKLFYLLAQSVPFKPVYKDLAESINVDRGDVPDLIEYLVRAGLVSELTLKASGLESVREVEKLYLNNTNLSYAFANETPNIGTMREIAFNQMTRVTLDVKASAKTDYYIDGYSFEVGGKNKGTQQISGVKKSYVVRDDTEFRALNFIPLWHFGFLY